MHPTGVSDQPEGRIRFSKEAQHHVVEGDRKGGGHAHGALPPPGVKKRWFPAWWSREAIIAALESVVGSPRHRDDSSRGFVNYYGEVNGVRVKVRVDRQGDIITGHPLDRDGVVQIEVRLDGQIVQREVPYGKSREVAW